MHIHPLKRSGCNHLKENKCFTERILYVDTDAHCFQRNYHTSFIPFYATRIFESHQNNTKCTCFFSLDIWVQKESEALPFQASFVILPSQWFFCSDAQSLKWIVRREACKGDPSRRVLHAYISNSPPSCCFQMLPQAGRKFSISCL